MIKTVIAKISAVIAISGALFLSYSLSGKVTDKSGAAIENATIKLVKANKSAMSGADGSWSILVPAGTQPTLMKKLLPVPILLSNVLTFAVSNDNERVMVRLYSIDGKCVHTALDKNLSAGFYRLNPFTKSLGSNTYLLCLQIGSENCWFKIPFIENHFQMDFLQSEPEKQKNPGQLEKRTVAIDSLIVSKDGYSPVVKYVTNYDDTVNVTLELYKPSYYLNPPSPCHNRFFVDKCIEGDPNSACGGKCRVANSCSPPEDQSKANLVKTFICPRFMLFSTEMIQAAKDDAKLYGWGDGTDAPFNYGVVGHDPDVGGVDDVSSSCCQCYQIIFQKPEPSSPQFPDLPNPKPLIVQSFNTAASGPKGFDVFMGAGGYGAFNSCFKDAAFSNTSKFDEFIYDKFPYQNPGSGGISFLRYQECLKGWPVTVDGVKSSPCQDKIKEMCDQALVNSSPQITADTRRSCSETNKVESLYHQNWEVIVKRVRCPDNLTRVTGCHLKEESLPLPFPKVQTPADAIANGTFRTGYHTTTMQDCCKPTCAWSNWTTDYKLPTDGDWNSFYSCDKNGVPFTKP